MLRYYSWNEANEIITVSKALTISFRIKARKKLIDD